MSLPKKILNFLHPVLRPVSKWYLSRTRTYTYQDITVTVFPGVFHPGLFFSTRALLAYLEERTLQGLNVLELGAGTGLISIYCYKKGARVTASDVNKKALRNIKENAQRNGAALSIVESDLFDGLVPDAFDLILINPPYYPRAVRSEEDMAWFCGEDFSYFKKLFRQLRERNLHAEVNMILSEDCNLEQIRVLAEANQLVLDKISEKRIFFEQNYIYSVSQLGSVNDASRASSGTAVVS